MRDAVEDVARAWTESARTGRPRDLVADTRRFTIDVVWRATTGAPLDDTTHRQLLAAARAHGILDALLDAVELQGPDGRLVRDNFVTFLVAGYETTAATLSWLLLLLHDHPGHRDWALAQGPAGSPERTAAIRALISETLRFCPAALHLLPPRPRPAHLPGRAAGRGGVTDAREGRPVVSRDAHSPSPIL